MRLVVKELAVVEIDELNDSKTMQSYFFQPPFSDLILPRHINRANNWVVQNMHGIMWNDGHIPYNQLRSILMSATSSGAQVFTKGSEKSAFLEYLLGCKVIDLDSEGCPKADDLFFPRSVACMFKHGTECPLNKALKYSFWMEQEKMKQQQKQHVEMPSWMTQPKAFLDAKREKEKLQQQQFEMHQQQQNLRKNTVVEEKARFAFHRDEDGEGSSWGSTSG